VDGFLYRGGSFTTINVPGAVVTIPESINDNGHIVGSFARSGGELQGFVGRCTISRTATSERITQ